MRHLLHCLYTDQLHPDLVPPPPPAPVTDDNPSPTQQERDLVALHVAADRYLVDVVQALVRHELVQHLKCHKANVLPVFDLALAVAPELAMHACQPFIEARAEDFLGGANPATEAQWLRLLPAAAAQVVSMEAKKMVAGLIDGLQLDLMTIDDLVEVVEPSRLLTDAQLAAAFKHAATTHRFFIDDLPARLSYSFNDRVPLKPM